MSDKKIIFMGTPLIAANYLNSLINNKYKVVSVFTQPPRKRNRGMKVQSSPVHELANQNYIRVDFPSRLDEETFEENDNRGAPVFFCNPVELVETSWISGFRVALPLWPPPCGPLHGAPPL